MSYACRISGVQGLSLEDCYTAETACVESDAGDVGDKKCYKVKCKVEIPASEATAYID